MRYAAALVVAAALAFGVRALADATQSRDGTVEAASTSTVMFTVEGRRFAQPLDMAAAGLWGTCSSNVSSRLVGEIERIDEATYRLRLRPRLDADDQTKLLALTGRQP